MQIAEGQCDHQGWNSYCQQASPQRNIAHPVGPRRIQDIGQKIGMPDFLPHHANRFKRAEVLSAKGVCSYFVLMLQWGMLGLPRPKEIHHAPF